MTQEATVVEYFVFANSFAAPFCSDSSTGFAKGEDSAEALNAFVRDYKHPSGLYAAMLYKSADAYHKGEPPLLKWLCNQEIARQKLTAGLGSWSELGHGPGDIEIDHKRHKIEDPKGGRIVLVDAKESAT